MKSIVTTTVFFVLAVIIFVVAIWFLLSKAFPNILYQLQKLLGIIKPTPIESAIMCSIARCKYGCNSFRVRDISWEDYDSSGKKITVNCWEKFCSGTDPSVYTEGDKICEKMPVTITLKTSQKISIDHLYDVTEGSWTELVVLTPHLGLDFFALSKLIGQIIDQLTRLPENKHTISMNSDIILAYGDWMECYEIGFAFVSFHLDCYKEVEIKEGNYVVLTEGRYKAGIPIGPRWYLVRIY